MKKIIFILGVMLITLPPIFAMESKGEFITLEWRDLIPEKEMKLLSEKNAAPVDHTVESSQSVILGSVREKLNGKRVKIPGFVIPLEGDGKTLTEFLLVPFWGACIHVPPPPANQIIHVRFNEGVATKKLWDVVYIIGTLKTETVSAASIESGYVIEGTEVVKYDGQFSAY